MQTQVETQSLPADSTAVQYRYTATYSPDDNKLRLYSSRRLPTEVYGQIHAAGFRFAPKQDLFVAPMWTPEREDILVELCGDIWDEDTSLVERSEARAERFETYSDKRADEAVSAKRAVDEIADARNGQPILVGHHSFDRAQRDAKKIDNGMRKAIRLWDTSAYWTQRAKGALKHASYKLRPDVRTRRIHRIEADRRKRARDNSHSVRFLAIWEKIHLPDSLKRNDGESSTFRDRALYIANYDRGLPFGTWSDLNSNKSTPEETQSKAIEAHQRVLAITSRWIAHFDNRLAYERAMLEEVGGIISDRFKPEKGGGCKCWASPRGGWSFIQRVNRVTVTVLDNWGNGGGNFSRTIPFDKLSELMSAESVMEARRTGMLVETMDKTGFVVGPSSPAALEPTESAVSPSVESSLTASSIDNREASFEAMRDQLTKGIKVVSADQLFPTPDLLAARMCTVAGLSVGHRILEPSAGTGRLLRAILACVSVESTSICAIEINQTLAESLRASFPGIAVSCQEFLSFDSGKFDRIIMNPPFKNDQDVEHVDHGISLLAPGGRLVAIMAKGFQFHRSRPAAAFRKRLSSLSVHSEELGTEAFESSGARVGTVLLTIDA